MPVPDAVVPGVFLAGLAVDFFTALFAGAAFADASLTGAFAGAFLPSAFSAGAFLAGAFFAAFCGGTALAGAFLAGASTAFWFDVAAALPLLPDVSCGSRSPRPIRLSARSPRPRVRRTTRPRRVAAATRSWAARFGNWTPLVVFGCVVTVASVARWSLFRLFASTRFAAF